MKNLEFLTERIAFSGGRVDVANHVIRNVKILGTESKNGRTYPLATIERSAALYEGAKVNVNHAKGSPGSPRDYQDRLGHLENVHVKGGGLYGDLRFNPKHPVAEMLAYDAEHSPANVGLSHNVQARTSRGPGGKLVVEAIEKVVSVDVVADAATTNGLYESISADGADQFVTRQELRGMLNVHDSVIDGLVRAGVAVAKLGMAEIFSLAEVRKALAGMTKSPVASEQREGVDVYAATTDEILAARPDLRQYLLEQTPKRSARPMSTGEFVSLVCGKTIDRTGSVNPFEPLVKRYR